MSSILNYQLPSDWNETELNNLIVSNSKITYGVVQPGEIVENGVPFIRGGDIFDGRIAIEKLRTISAEISHAYKRTLLEGGELLMSLVGYPGEVAIAPQKLAGANIARQVAYIKLDKKVDSRYVMYYLQSTLGKYFLFQKSTGSAQQVINLIDLKDVIVLTAPLPEQQKIAAILTAVDDVIESTQAQINKLKDLKAGMMQELLTKGIGHTEFKDSPVGRIPKAWKVTIFEKIAIKIQDGTHFSPQSKEGECLYITSKNIQDGRLDLRRIQYISQSEHDEIYKRCNVQFGDVLLTKDGANTGNCAMNTLTQPFSLLSSVAFLRCDELTCLNEFLYQYILSMPCQKQIADSMTGNAITRLTLTIIKGLRIVLPTIGEQRKIVNALGAIDKSIDQKEGKLKMILNSKKALMQDLLTGKVRVKVD